MNCLFWITNSAQQIRKVSAGLALVMHYTESISIFNSSVFSMKCLACLSSGLQFVKTLLSERKNDHQALYLTENLSDSGL